MLHDSYLYHQQKRPAGGVELSGRDYNSSCLGVFSFPYADFDVAGFRKLILGNFLQVKLKLFFSLVTTAIVSYMLSACKGREVCFNAHVIFIIG